MYHPFLQHASKAHVAQKLLPLHVSLCPSSDIRPFKILYPFQVVICTKQINDPTSRKNRDTIPGQPANLWHDNWSLLFPPCEDVCLLGSAARGYRRAAPAPIHSAIYIPCLPQALSAAHTRNKLLSKKPHPNHWEGIFKRENVSVAWRLLLMFLGC